MKNHIYLDRNENQYPLSPSCKKVIELIDDTEFNNYDRDKEKEQHLIENLSATLKIKKENILLGNGAEDLLKNCIHLFLQKNDYLFTGDMAWRYYQDLAIEKEAKVCYFNINEKKDSFELDIESFSRVYSKFFPAVVIIASPNNPTGNIVSLDKLTQILNISKNSTVILDESYWHFNEYFNYDTIVDNYPNTIIIRSFSKFFGLAGIRMGYAIASRKFFHKLFLLMNRYLGFNQFSLKLCAAALNDIRYFENLNKIYESDKLNFYNKLSNATSIKVYRSYANFILLKHNSELFDQIKKKFEQYNIFLSYIQNDKMKNFIRISLGTSEQNDKVLDILQEYKNV